MVQNYANNKYERIEREVKVIKNAQQADNVMRFCHSSKTRKTNNIYGLP